MACTGCAIPTTPTRPAGFRRSGETVLRSRHRDFYLELAEQFDHDWFGPRQPEWSRRMCAELPNLRTALGFCLEHPDDEARGVGLAGALYYFWYGCGETREGRHWLERTLAADPRPTWERMRALAAFGRLLILQGDPVAAADTARECLELAHAYDDEFYISHAMQTLGLVSRTMVILPAAAPVLARRWHGPVPSRWTRRRPRSRRSRGRWRPC